MNTMIVIYLDHVMVYYTSVKYNIYYDEGRRFGRIGDIIVTRAYYCPIEKLIEVI